MYVDDNYKPPVAVSKPRAINTAAARAAQRIRAGRGVGKNTRSSMLNGISDAPFDDNLGWGFSLPNPVKAVQQVVQKVAEVVNKVTPPALQTISPVNVIAKQAAAVTGLADKTKALALRTAQLQASAVYKATAASPLGRKLVTPVLDVTAIKSPIGRQLMPSISADMVAAQRANDAVIAQNAQAQAAADEQYKREEAMYRTQQAALDAQYAKEQAAYDAQQSAYDAEIARQNQAAYDAMQPSGGSGGTSSTPWTINQQPAYDGSYQPDISQLDTASTDSSALDVTSQAAPTAPAPTTSRWRDWWLSPIIPWGSKIAVTTAPAATAPTSPAPILSPVPAWDPYSLSTENTDITGDTMQLSNIPSARNIFPGTFNSSGMGGLSGDWGDFLSTVTTMYGQKTAASIQQSQAAQADATARIAAANAAATAAQSRPALSTPVMLAAAAALGGVLLFMRKRRA